jgi:hypothetical protein
MGSTVVDPWLGGADDGAWKTRAAVSSGFRPYLFCWQFFFVLFIFVFVLCIPLVSPVQYAYVLLKFYWNCS